MKKLFFISTFILAMLFSASMYGSNPLEKSYDSKNYQAKIYLTSNLCLYCYNQIEYLNELPSNFNLTFVVSPIDFRVWSKKIKEYELSKEFELIEESHLKTKDRLYVDVWDEDKLIFSFPLEKYYKFLPYLKIIDGDFEIKDSVILENTVLSSRLEIDAYDGNVVFHDGLFSEVVVYDEKEKKLTKFSNLDLSAIDLLSYSDYDIKEYKSEKDILKKFNAEKPLILGGYYKKDTMSLLASVQVPFNIDGQTALKPELFIINFNNGKLSDVFYIDEPLFSMGNKQYGVYNKLFSFQNCFLTNIMSVQQEGVNYLIAKWEIADGKLIRKNLKIKHPSIQKPEMPYTYSSMGVCSDYLFFHFYPLVYYPKEKRLINYSRAFNSLVDFMSPYNIKETHFKVIDLFFLKDSAMIIFKTKDDYYLGLIDIFNKKMINYERLELPITFNKKILRFNSDGELIGLSLDRSKLYYFK